MSAQNDAREQADVKPCLVKQLPGRLEVDAVKTAVALNPLNGILASAAPDGIHPARPLRLTIDVFKRWDKNPRALTVSFMEATSKELQDRIIEHMNAWSDRCCISFKRAVKGVGEVRISFGPGGYWSYLGTDILHVPKDEQTMNLEGFSMDTPEEEYKRVVRHETGHTLGFEHEHMRQELVNRIDPAKAYKYFEETQGWDKKTVDEQVLTPLDKHTIMGTPPDVTSIMCYQLPGKIMKNGIGIPGGKDINPTDYAFAGKLYPKPVPSTKKMPAAMALRSGSSSGWNRAKDVKFSADLIEQFNQATLI